MLSRPYRAVAARALSAFAFNAMWRMHQTAVGRLGGAHWVKRYLGRWRRVGAARGVGRRGAAKAREWGLRRVMRRSFRAFVRRCR
jgi:hypothetical protein